MKTITWKGHVEKTNAPYGMYEVAYEYEDSQGRGFSRYVYDTYEEARDFANTPCRPSPHVCAMCGGTEDDDGRCKCVNRDAF